MRVQVPRCRPMLQPDQVSIADEINGIRSVPEWATPVELLYKPPIVAILVRVSCNLLLLGADSFRIQVRMRMKITSASDTILHR